MKKLIFNILGIIITLIFIFQNVSVYAANTKSDLENQASDTQDNKLKLMKKT